MALLESDLPVTTVSNSDRRAEMASGSKGRVVAVIDIGTTSIRMAIAEITPDGEVRQLETLSQAVNLGKDTFTSSVIAKSTIEDCVRVLKSYRRILDEYQIKDREQIRVVATSAVREASDRLGFLDRVYSATGFEIVSLDEAEVNRITYLSIQPQLDALPDAANTRTVIIEVGGGATELLVVEGKDVLFSSSYRLGSLRLRQMLEAYQAPQHNRRKILENQIRLVVDQVVHQVSRDASAQMIVLGGDVRFAASQILPDWEPGTLGRIPITSLEEFADRILHRSEDDLVHDYRLTYPDAETVGPALLAYVMLARAFGLDEVLISNVNLRDGLLQEFAAHRTWTTDFTNQLVQSALSLGRKFQFDESHARKVADLSRRLFVELREEHRLEARYEVILYVAALLHEIGLFISTPGHHRHSMYLIQNSELFGLGKRDVLLIALVARYHRRASPRPSHEGYNTLDRDDRIAVAKMAAMLRIADALDRSHSQRVRDIQFSREDSRLIILVPGVEDVSLEQLALRQKGSLLEDVFGIQVLLRGQGPSLENR